MDNVALVQDVCGVNRERAQELLEAGGSAERAIDVHFSQQQQQQSQPVAGRVHEQPQHKKAKLTNALIEVEDTKAPESKQRKVSSFFSPPAKQPARAAASSCSSRLARSPAPSPQQSVSTIATKSNASSTATNVDERLQYMALANTFTEMTATTKRLAKLDALQRLLCGVIDALGGIDGNDETRREDSHVLKCALELVLGNISGTPLQVSGAAVSQAVREVTGASTSQLRSAYRSSGDLGDAAAKFTRNQRLLVQPKPLTIVGVYNVLQQIAAQTGKGSQGERHVLMVKLLRSCKSQEQRFLVRTLLGNMRLGANIKTILAGLAMAVEATSQDSASNTATAIQTLQDTFDFCPRLDKIALALLVGGIPYMKETCVLEVGTPVNPMLATPAHSLEEVEKLLQNGPAVAEWKYDGVRCQAHYDGTSVTLYSRHMIDNTKQFPDAVDFVLQARKPTVTSFIIDAEIVGVETDDGGAVRLLPFQDLSTRKGVAKQGEAQIEIRIFAFDLMFLNGKSIVNETLSARQRLLKEYFVETQGFAFASFLMLTKYDEKAIQSFLETAIKGGAEGLMVKLMGAIDEVKTSNEPKATPKPIPCSYESGTRSQTWLKVKRDYVDGYSDTIDVVPIGAWYGTGRKAQKNFLSPVLLAVYDEEEDVFRSICRCMSFTDAMYNAMREFYFEGKPYPADVGVVEKDAATTGKEDQEGNSDNDVDETTTTILDNEDGNEDDTSRVNCYPSRPSALVVTNESPPVWFKPMEVFEVSFADLTLSRQHTAAAGLVDPTRGVALRFPRFKHRRPDKGINQATSSTQIAELFAKQAKQGAARPAAK